MPDPKPIDPAKLRYLESRARALAKQIETGLHATSSTKYGFALLLFSFDGSELTYISNARRATWFNALKNCLTVGSAETSTDFPAG